MSTDPVVNYEFPCFLGRPHVVEESVMGAIVAVPSSSSSGSTTVDRLSCPYPTTDGVASASPLQSAGGVSALGPSFRDATALTLEAWFTPVYSSGGGPETTASPVLPIVTVGREVGSAPRAGGGPASDYEWCDGLQLTVVQRGDVLEVRYRDYFNHYFGSDDDDYAVVDDDEFACRILQVRDWKLVLHELHHIVVVWEQGGARLAVYGNGSLLLQIDLLRSDGSVDDIKFDLRSWDQDYRLQLYANDVVSGMFPGTIHRASLYNRTLSAQAVRRAYEEGVAERSAGVVMDPNDPLHLVANPAWDAVRAVQGRPVSLTVGGTSNVSTPYWDVLVEVTTLPRHGVLLTSDGRNITMPGSRLPLERDQPRTAVTYRQRDDDFFTTPTHSFDGRPIVSHDGPDGGQTPRQAVAPSESFSYRLIAVDKVDPSRVFGRSETILQEVHIVHLNHRPSLTSPENATEPDRQPTGSGARPWATLDDVVLHDSADHNINRVRVDIWAVNGTLSIESEEALQMADFGSCSGRQPTLTSESPPSSQWFCFGDGSKNRNMTFVATPSNVSAILSNIRYDAFYWDQEDSIVLRIHDGSGGSCLTEEEHLAGRYRPPRGDPHGRNNGFGTIHEGCFSLVTEVRVPPLGRTYSARDVGVRGFFNELFDFKGFGIPDLVFWICVVFTLAACCCCVRVMYSMCCCFRGARIQVEDNGFRQEVILAPPPPDDHLVLATMNCYDGGDVEYEAKESV